MSRPHTVTWLVVAVFLLSASNLLSAVRVFSHSAYMIQLGLSAPPAYLGATGLIWAITLGAAAVGLWRLRAWGRWLGLGAVSLYCLHTWLNRIVFDVSAYARQVWPWEAAMSLFSLAVTWGILWLPGVRASFGRGVSHEWRGRP